MVAELCKNPARRMCVCSGNMVRIFRVFRNIHVLFQYPCSQASHHSNIWQSQLDAKKKVRKMHVQKKSAWKRQHATELVCTCMFSFWDLHSFARTLFQMQSALGVQRSTVWQQKQEVSTPVRKASMKMQNTIRLRWPRRLHAARREKLRHWILNTFVGTATAKFGFQAKTRHRNNSPKVLHVPGDWGRSRS